MKKFKGNWRGIFCCCRRLAVSRPSPLRARAQARPHFRSKRKLRLFLRARAFLTPKPSLSAMLRIGRTSERVRRRERARARASKRRWSGDQFWMTISLLPSVIEKRFFARKSFFSFAALFCACRISRRVNHSLLRALCGRRRHAGARKCETFKRTRESTF